MELRSVVVTVVAAVNRDGGERVVLEAARRAADLDTDLHVIYVLEIGGFGRLELSLAERIGLPVGLDVIRERCARIADGIAEPIVDEYEATGLVGDPIEEIESYARRVDAECVVIDGRRSHRGLDRLRNHSRTLPDSEVPVVPVYE